MTFYTLNLSNSSSLSLEFKKQDVWIGIFWKREKGRPMGDNSLIVEYIDIWVCVVPCFPFHLRHRKTVWSELPRIAQNEQHES